MKTEGTHQEAVDRLTILLAAEPRPGWEGIFDAISRREVERLMPTSETKEPDLRPAKGEEGNDNMKKPLSFLPKTQGPTQMGSLREILPR
jgi:hypothetical protein